MTHYRTSFRNGAVLLAVLAGLMAVIGFMALSQSSTPRTANAGDPCAGGRDVAGTDRTITLDVDGLTRRYKLIVPQRYAPQQPAPLVVSLHAALSTPEWHQSVTGWHTYGEREGFITALPDASEARAWNDGLRDDPALTAVDDVAFIAAVLDDVADRVCVDANRVYLSGIGSGASMSSRAACELSGRVTAAGFVNGAYPPTGTGCIPDRAVSVIAFHETQALDGDTDAADALRYWVDANRCAAPMAEMALSSTIRRLDFPGCERAAQVLLYLLARGDSDTPASIDLTGMMWRFFAGRDVIGRDGTPAPTCTGGRVDICISPG